MIKKNKPKIIAHRGNCEGLPENNETAFKQSIAYSVDGIETDVQLTKDNIPVIFHDRVSFKLTGTRKWISSYTLDELLQFHIDNERILTLDRTINLFNKKTGLWRRKPDQWSNEHPIFVNRPRLPGWGCGSRAFHSL